jgi:hypothetical protein
MLCRRRRGDLAALVHDQGACAAGADVNAKIKNTFLLTFLRFFGIAGGPSWG